MIKLIQSLPSPSLQWGITHSWMRDTSMVDGDALVMMMALILYKFPSQQGARTEFLDPNLGFWWRRRGGTLSGKLSNPPWFLGRTTTYRRRGRPRRCLGRLHPLQARPMVGPRLGWVWGHQASPPSLL